MALCQNPNCKLDYPHEHVRLPDDNPAWFPTIDHPAVSARWPDRLKWQRREKVDAGGLLKFGWFASHSKFQLPWKLDLESGLDDSDWDSIAKIIAWKFAFRSVYGIPKGGERLARALDKYCEPGYPTLIVDDVLTTGRSFIQARAALGNLEGCIGVVAFSRGPCPDWVWPIFVVSEWAQSRATGLG